MSNFSSKQAGICTCYRSHSLMQKQGWAIPISGLGHFFKESSTVLKKPACKCTIALMEILCIDGVGFLPHTKSHQT